jgi:hypothetical protein
VIRRPRSYCEVYSRASSRCHTEHRRPEPWPQITRVILTQGVMTIHPTRRQDRWTSTQLQAMQEPSPRRPTQPRSILLGDNGFVGLECAHRPSWLLRQYSCEAPTTFISSVDYRYDPRLITHFAGSAMGLKVAKVTSTEVLPEARLVGAYVDSAELAYQVQPWFQPF